jgi:membrane-bound ClpP family serine protease
MDINSFISPTFAYLMLVAGFVLGMLAIFSPGTGILEIGALFAFILAGWQILSLPINWWALLILILGVFPFLIAVRFSKKIYFLVIAIAAFVVGSVFLFDAPGSGLAIDPFLAIIVSTLVASSFWVVTTKYIQAANTPTTHDLSSLIGQIGEAKTDIFNEGSVYVGGEMWSAHSNQPIPRGAHVSVIDRQGLILTVEIVPPGEG